jgi:hypothetical protein
VDGYKARIMNLTEIIPFFSECDEFFYCQYDQNTPEWLNAPDYEYWLSAESDVDTIVIGGYDSYAKAIFNDSGEDLNTTDFNYAAIRPVINVYKSKI